MSPYSANALSCTATVTTWGHLLEQGRAVLEFRPVPPEAGSQLLNAREKGPNAFATSTFHPLAYDPLEVGWDPRAKRWTGRRGLCGLKKEETSFWCSGWGASASDIGMDSNFQHITGKKGHDTAIHTRGWR